MQKHGKVGNSPYRATIDCPWASVVSLQHHQQAHPSCQARMHRLQVVIIKEGQGPGTKDQGFWSVLIVCTRQPKAGAAPLCWHCWVVRSWFSVAQPRDKPACDDVVHHMCSYHPVCGPVDPCRHGGNCPMSSSPRTPSLTFHGAV